jgi:hypothetical protein
MEKLKEYATKVAGLAVTTGPFMRIYPLATNAWSAIPPYPTPARPIMSKEIEEIMPAMQSGISELREAIINGYYDALVGDDTSGRIPTLILRGVISHVNTALGRPSLPAIFVKGRGEGLPEKDSQKLLQKMHALTKGSDKPRALIVTEYMSGGGHVAGIGKVIHQANVAYDIFAVGKNLDIINYRNEGVIRGDENIFPTARILERCPSLYRNRALSGYTLGLDEKVRFIPEHRDSFNQARKDVQAAVARLINNNFR